MKNVMANIHPFYDVYVSEKNMGFWKIIMEGVFVLKPSELISSAARKHVCWRRVLDVLRYGLHLPEPSTEGSVPNTYITPKYHEARKDLS